jgi:hypothetical protein
MKRQPLLKKAVLKRRQISAENKGKRDTMLFPDKKPRV